MWSKMNVKLIIMVIAMIAIASSCTDKKENTMGVIDKTTTGKAIKLLSEKHPSSEHARIERGVSQVAAFWMDSDGSDKILSILFLTVLANTTNRYGGISQRFHLISIGLFRLKKAILCLSI
jgi:hypothetical protein